ncbi:MAG TPA: hypothetical protein VFS33_05055 [Gemmatimonadales bacterium]|nr:hypothetical protein [Gemmatimonadales bacterium]
MSARRRRAGAALMLMALLQGCAINFDATSLGVPVTMASPVGQPPEGERFRVSSHAVYAFWGLANIKRPSLEKSLATQLVGGKGVSDLKIGVHSSFTDILLTVLTGGLLVPRSVTFEGVVAK